jgi:hypothetical protein
MTAETCIPCASNDYRFHVVLADGTAYRPLAECIEAGNEAAGSPGPYGPAREIRAFCWCVMHPSSSECVQQSLALDARDGGAHGRQPKCHRTGGARDDGSGSDGDPDPGPPAFSEEGRSW